MALIALQLQALLKRQQHMLVGLEIPFQASKRGNAEAPIYLDDQIIPHAKALSQVWYLCQSLGSTPVESAQLHLQCPAATMMMIG